MCDTDRFQIGAVGWVDLTVDAAEQVKRFYSEVVGWRAEPVEMEGYSDFNMTGPQNGKPFAGICHKRGPNAGLPSQWLVYITVEDVERSAARCVELGGRIVTGPTGMGGQGRYCVIEDPAGAVAALIQPAL